MKMFPVLVCIAGLLPAADAAPAFSWFHTRPKAVILQEETSVAQNTPVAQNKVAYHGNAVYPGSGRLYFEDAADARRQSSPQPRSRMTNTVSSGWRFESVPPKAKTAKTTPAK